MSRFDIGKMGGGQQRQQSQQRREDITLIDDTEEEVDEETQGERSAKKQQLTLDPQTQEQLMRLGEQRAMARLAADPDMLKLMRAKEAKKRFKLNVDDDDDPSTVDRGEEDEPQTAEEVDLNELDNRGMAKHLLGNVSKILDMKLGKLIKPLEQQLGQVTSYARENENEKMLREIDSAKSEFPDFDDHIPQMSKLADENRGLKPKELYLLAKLRSGSKLKTDRRMESERPSTAINRPSTSLRVKGLAPGKAGFSQLLQASLERNSEQISEELDQD